LGLNTLRLFFCTVLIIWFLIPLHIVAQELVNQVSFSVKPIYNSNENFDHDDELETLAVIYTPAFKLNYSNALLYLSTGIVLDGWVYFNEKELNRLEVLCSLDGRYKISDKADIAGNVIYMDRVDDNIIDYSLGGGPSNVERKQSQLQRKSLDAGLDFSHRYSRLSDVRLAYDYYKVVWDDPQGNDYDYHFVEVSYGRQFPNQLDTLALSQSFSLKDSQTTDIHGSEFKIGWRHKIDRVYMFETHVGGKYEKLTYTDERDTLYVYEPITDIILSKNTPLFSWTVGFEHYFETSVGGETYQFNRLYWKPKISIGRFWSAYCLFDYILPNEVGGIDPDIDNPDWALKSQYFAVEPSIDYYFSRRWQLNVAGDYTVYHEAQRERLRVWVELRYQFRL